jgi:hypothetical protein
MQRPHSSRTRLRRNSMSSTARHRQSMATRTVMTTGQITDLITETITGTITRTFKYLS